MSKIPNGPWERFRCLDDRSLLGAVLLSDELAWRELVRRFRGLIYHCIGTATKKRGDQALPREESDEIFCEVCVRLLRNDMHALRRYDPARGTKLGTWIGMIAVHTCYDHLRSGSSRWRVERPALPDRPDEQPGPLDVLLVKERRQQLAALVNELTPRERTFFELYYTEDLEPPEVAEAMSISVGSVYAQKHKLRQRLSELAADVETLAA